MSATRSQQRYQHSVEKLKFYGRASDRIGKHILLHLWKINRGLYLMGNYDKFEDFVADQLTDSFASGSAYLRDLTLVTTRVFAYVEERCKAGNPVLDPDGIPLTVVRLIRSKNWLGRLVIISQYIQRADDEEDADNLFNLAFSLSRDELAKHLRALFNGRTPIRIERLIRETDDGYEVIFRNVDGDGLKLLHKQTDAFSEDVIR